MDEVVGLKFVLLVVQGEFEPPGEEVNDDVRVRVGVRWNALVPFQMETDRSWLTPFEHLGVDALFGVS